MFSKIRPFIFKLDPELAHDLAIKALKTNLIVKDYKKNELILKTKLFGKEIPNPIGIAAGFDKNAEVYNPLFKLGFGFVEVGTVTPLSQYGNPNPNLNNELYTSAFLSNPAAIPIGFGISLSRSLTFKQSYAFTFTGTTLVFRALIAKSCAVSGSNLKIKDLILSNIIYFFFDKFLSFLNSKKTYEET